MVYVIVTFSQVILAEAAVGCHRCNKIFSEAGNLYHKYSRKNHMKGHFQKLVLGCVGEPS